MKNRRIQEEDGRQDSPTKEKVKLFKTRTRQPSFVLAVFINTFRLSVLLVLLVMLSGLGVVLGIAKAYVETAPNLDLAKIDEQAQTSFFYDKEGTLITDYKGTEDRVAVSISAIPEKMRNAFIAAEDIRFYSHNGVDLKRIFGAFVSNFVQGTQQGGSTITQQLIKNTVLSNEQSYKRKIQEAYLAMQLEGKYSKNEILENYLNTIYLGENYYGVKVAAKGYFGKELHELSLRECAMLAGMTTNPYYYNCRRNLYTRQSSTVDYVKITNNRTNYVLRVMYENQMITHQEFTQALDTQTAVVLKEAKTADVLYPYVHYVEYAAKDVVQVLLRLNKLENTSANRAKMELKLRTGGYKVYLALDSQIQNALEDTLYNYKDYPKLRDPGAEIYRARNRDGTYEEIAEPQAAACVIDYRTGELKAIVGSRTPPKTKKTLNRAADMNMPVGSSIKPLSVYAPAFEMGYGGGSIAYNMPIPIPGWRGNEGKDSWPKNYGGSNYRGPETFRTALVKSDNTAAASVLMRDVGLDRAVDALRRLGVDESHISKTPFGVALGSSGITPIEMATAFGVLANGGVYQAPLSILGILDRDNKVIYDAHQNQERRQVFKPSTAYLTVDILKQAVSQGTGTAAKIKGQTVAGKTGTNSDQKGVFFAGMTGYYSASVWIGHDNYKALSSKTTGGNSAAKLWQTFMSRIHTDKGLANRDILEGSPGDYGLIKVTTCAVSGQLATDACAQDSMGYGVVTDYIDRESQLPSCQMHRLDKVCMQSNMLAGPYCPQESVQTRGVVVLPVGHPLEAYIGTQYESVLHQYLGSFIALRYEDQLPACTLHTQPEMENNGPEDVGGMVENSLVNDANNLLIQASNLLSARQPGTSGYENLLNAINNLHMVLSQNPNAEDLTNAMVLLTQAMAGY